MIAYIREFQFVEHRKFRCVNFDYYTGYKWKHLSLIDPFKKPEIASYSRFMLDAVIKEICGKETDVFKRTELLNEYENLVVCSVQFNPEMFKQATKLFM